jgi:hypothetical protein
LVVHFEYQDKARTIVESDTLHSLGLMPCKNASDRKIGAWVWNTSVPQDGWTISGDRYSLNKLAQDIENNIKKSMKTACSK